ncbi:MAG: dihydroorotase, partial [Dehalococcoidia bacterium]|nr:dihydroorotase [Dehalococcoidia bacterium]
CVTRGREGKALTDMAELAKAGVMGFSDDGSPVADGSVMRQALERAASLGLPIINHCEEPGLSRGGVMNHGALANSLGLRGSPASAEEVMVARDVALAGKTGGRLHLAHLSAAGSVGLVRRAKARGIPVTAEVTPHHLTLTEEWVKTKPGLPQPYDTNAKVNPPLRTQRDVDALVQGLKDGTIDCIATDHAPHTLADKAGTFQEAAFGISGLETALGLLMALVHDGHLDMVTLVERLTAGPARIVNMPEVCSGSLRPGSPADVTIFDTRETWIVDTSKFASRGRNTPLEGATLRGKVMATIVDGCVVYIDEAVKVG